MTLRRDWAYYVRRLFFYSFIILLATVCIIPLYWMVRASFMRNTAIMIIDPFVFWPYEMIFQNYVDAFNGMNFLRGFRNTMIIMVGTMSGVLLTSMMAAYAFARIRWKGRSLCFALIMSTMMLPGTVTLISQYIMWANLNFVDTFVPLIAPAWFGGGAFNIFLLRQFLMNIPRELDEAAVVDGAGHLQIFFRIVAPLSRSAIIVVGLFTFLGVWNDFFGPLIYLMSRDNYTLVLGLLFFRGEFTARWDLIMAGSTMLILPCIILFVFAQKQLIEGISLTGLKG